MTSLAQKAMSNRSDSALYNLIFKSQEYQYGLSRAFLSTLHNFDPASPFQAVCLNSKEDAVKFDRKLGGDIWDLCYLWGDANTYVTNVEDFPHIAFICPAFFDLGPEPPASSSDGCPEIQGNRFVELTKEKKALIYTQGLIAVAMVMGMTVPSIGWHDTIVSFDGFLADLNSFVDEDPGTASTDMTSYLIFTSSMNALNPVLQPEFAVPGRADLFLFFTVNKHQCNAALSKSTVGGQSSPKIIVANRLDAGI